ncbi:xanthine dehydrogenase family protein subunit M [Thermopolyspora sp. NPDC052614]|uniref:FAD binding domain-containing protein n=1 Tax=Thermopolyspora sp. NPDC052614 TaxID=3155682 RepID=UPI00343BAB55
MRPFDYERPRRVEAALAAVEQTPGAVYLGGGTNLVDLMRLGVVEPECLVDVTGLPCDRIEEDGGGLRIGAAVRIGDLAAHPAVRRRFPMLAQAALRGGSGQIMNMATVAGNLLQRTRCPYFNDVTKPCNKREPGSGCPARNGEHRNLAIIGHSAACVATHPSDLAVALAALDATVCVEGVAGPRRVPLTGLYRPPGDDPRRDTVLEPADLITGIEVPAPRVTARSRYRKVSDRASFAFAVVSVAVVLDLGVRNDGETGGLAEGRAVRDCRIVFGGIAPMPWRAVRAEEELRGARAAEPDFARAARAELAAARPLRDNAFKVPLARNLLVRTLTELME